MACALALAGKSGHAGACGGALCQARSREAVLLGRHEDCGGAESAGTTLSLVQTERPDLKGLKCTLQQWTSEQPELTADQSSLQTLASSLLWRSAGLPLPS